VENLPGSRRHPAEPEREGLLAQQRMERAQRDFVEGEGNFRALANSIPQLAWMADGEGGIFWYNDRWYEYTGGTLDEMRGWGWRKAHHPDHVERVVAGVKRASQSGEPWEDTFPLRSRSGEYRWFLSRAVPIKDAEGNVLRWLGTNTDVTESERRREELARVTESRERLMRGFSHDVRNPLGVADAQAWLLEDGRLMGELTEKQRECVVRIRRSIRSSLRLIEDLVEVMRAEAGQLGVERLPTDVVALAREAVGDFQAPAIAAGFSLEIRAPEALIVATDPDRVGQVLANLLSNAVKYADKGPVTVQAAPRREGGPRPGEWIALSVSDIGPGIPPDKRESIFEEYVRLDPQAQPGAGIGLAISRRIARAIGGDLTVASEPGGGSTFTLWLPAGGATSSPTSRP
jgi:PAS domain S-box-containing protein